MAQRYSIKMILKMKAHFKANPSQKTLVGYDDFRREIIQDGKDFRRWFMECLHTKINTKCNLPMPKKAFDPYHIEFYRDQWAIKDKKNRRIRIHGFQSKVCRQRLAHLIEEREAYL
jgi:hypothetical protein